MIQSRLDLFVCFHRNQHSRRPLPLSSLHLPPSSSSVPHSSVSVGLVRIVPSDLAGVVDSSFCLRYASSAADIRFSFFRNIFWARHLHLSTVKGNLFTTLSASSAIHPLTEPDSLSPPQPAYSKFSIRSASSHLCELAGYHLFLARTTTSLFRHQNSCCFHPQH